MVWSLALHGWRYWNRSSKLVGNSAGARVRRWWYKTNNWSIKETFGNVKGNKRLASEMGEVSWVERVPDFTDVM